MFLQKKLGAILLISLSSLTAICADQVEQKRLSRVKKFENAVVANNQQQIEELVNLDQKGEKLLLEYIAQDTKLPNKLKTRLLKTAFENEATPSSDLNLFLAGVRGNSPFTIKHLLERKIVKISETVESSGEPTMGPFNTFYDEDATSENEDTSLLNWAVLAGHRDIIKILLANGAKINGQFRHPKKSSPLEIAVKNLDADTTAFLIEKGARLDDMFDLGDQFGLSPLEYLDAVFKEKPYAIKDESIREKFLAVAGVILVEGVEFRQCDLKFIDAVIAQLAITNKLPQDVVDQIVKLGNPNKTPKQLIEEFKKLSDM